MTFRDVLLTLSEDQLDLDIIVSCGGEYFSADMTIISDSDVLKDGQIVFYRKD